MKLHLPSGLRKALLACLAALASLAPLTLTSASGSLFLGTLAWSLITPPVQAKDATWKGGSDAKWKTGETTTNWWTSGSGDANFEDSDNVTFSTAPGSVTLGSNVTAGNITLNGGAWTFAKGSDFTLTLAGNITLSGADTSGSFSDVSVTLSGAAVQTFTGPGTLTFGAITGNSHGLTIGDGTTATTVRLTDKQATTVNHNFGAVEVKAGSKLVIGAEKEVNAWGNCTDSGVGTDYVYGEGTVVLSCGDKFIEMAQNTHLFTALLNGMKDGETLGTLQIGEGIEGENAAFKISGNNGFVELGQTFAKHVKNIVVTSGNSLDLQGAKLLVKLEEGGIEGGNTLHIVGNGRNESGGLGALSIRINATTVGWNVELDGDARIGTDSAGTLTGNLKTNGHVLTKSGGNSLTLSGTITDDLKLNFVAGKVVLGANGGTGGTVAEVSTAESGSGTLEAAENTTWTLSDLNIAADTNLTLAGAGTFDLSNTSFTLGSDGGTVTLGDGSATTTKFTGTITLSSTGGCNWVFSANADLTGLKIAVDGVELSVPTEYDPFWSSEFPEGLGDIPLSQLQPSQGQLGENQTFGWSADGKLVIQAADAGLPTQRLPFSTGDINWNTAKQIYTSSDAAIDVNYDDDDKANYNGEGVTVVSENVGATTVSLSGNNVQHLKLEWRATIANMQHVMTINSLPTNLTALWLNCEADGAGVGSFKFGAVPPTGLTDIYVSGTGLLLSQSTGEPFTSITIHLGKADKRVYGLSTDTGLQKIALWIADNATIKGLEMQESALVVEGNGGTFNVGTLTGSGDLRLAALAAGGAAASSTLIVTQGNQFKGHIDFIFQGHGSRKVTVKIADGQTLTMAGIASTNNNDGNTATEYGGGGFAVQDGGTSATVKVLGSNPDAALGITFGEGVTLEIAKGASQAFGHFYKAADGNKAEIRINTEISNLTGAGALGVTGNVTVKALESYTGDVHLWNGGALTVGVAGGDAPSTSSGTLSKLVLRDGESTLNVHGAWTLQGLERMEGTKLTIGQGTTGDSLTFGGDNGLALVNDLTLSLGNGVTYNGKLTIVAADTPGTGKIELGEGLEDILGNLVIELSGLSGKGTDWEGLSLFTVSGGTLSNELCRMLEGHLTSDNEDFRLKVSTDGTVTLAGLPVLLWTDGSDDHTWLDSGGGNVWTPQGENAAGPYTSGADVIFAAIGGQAKQTVNVSGTVHARNITVGSEDEAAQYTFNEVEGTSATIDVTGDLTLVNGSSATFNTAVSLNKVGGTSIIGKGTVTFGGTGVVTASGLVVGDGVTVEVSTSGNKNFGGIEVQEGGRFVVQSGNGWTVENTNNKVHGDGTLVLEGIGLADLTTFVDGSAGVATLGNLELESGTGLAIGGVSANGMLGKCTNIWVRDGAGLSMNAPAMSSTGVTLHLAGNGATSLAGDGGAAGEDGGKLAAEAAFSVYNYGWSNGVAQDKNKNPLCEWNIVLEEDAKIAVGGVSNSNKTESETLTVNGSFDMQGNALTKVGIATMKLTKMEADGEDAAEFTHAGVITVNGGTLEISGLAGDGVTSGIVATTVDLNNANGDGTGTFRVSGDGNTYTVQQVVLGDGEGTIGGTGLAVYAMLEAGGGSTLVVTGAQTDVDGGTKNVALDLREGAGAIAGGGTVELRGKAVGGKGLRVGGAGTVLLVKEAWATGDFTGGLYLTQNGTVKLGADIEIGFLGGTEDGYGGTITVDGTDERMVKLTTGGGSARNVTVDENVKLMLGMGSGGQTFTVSHLNGNIDIGTGAELIFDGVDGASGSNMITQGSGKSLTGAGKLVVQGGSETAAALAWAGDSTNFAGTLVFGTQEGGNSFLALGSDMTVGNIETVSAGTVNSLGGDAKLTLNYTGTSKSTIAATEETKLTLGEDVTFEKKGTGEVEIHFLEGEKVLVNGGKLIASAAEGGWAVDSAEVNAEFEVAAGVVTLNGLAGSGSVTGAGTVDLNAATGSFEGTVSSNLVYDVEGGKFEIGSFSGAGNVTVGNGAGVTVTNELTAYTGTVTLNGGTFTAGGTVRSVVVGAEGGTLSGTGNNGLTAALSDGGGLTAQGKLALSGAIAGQLLVDDGATVTGTGLSVSGVKGGAGNTGTLSGSITVTGNGDTNSFGGKVSDLDITVGSGSAEARQAFTGSNITIGTAQVKSQGTLSLSSGTVGTLTLDGGATLDLSGARTKVSIDALKGQNATSENQATIVIGDVRTAKPGVTGLQLDIGDLTGFGEKGLILDLSALPSVSDAFSYQLFDPLRWGPGWLDNIELDPGDLEIDGTHRLTLTDKGVLQYTVLGVLTWSGSAASDGVWSTDGDTDDWMDEAYFENGDNVSFGGTGLAKSQVTVSGEVIAGEMSVSADGYSFTGAKAGDSLSAASLELSGTGTTTFDVDTTVTALTGKGNLVLKDRMSVGAALSRTSDNSSYTGTITLQQGGTLEASGEANVDAAGGTLSGTGGVLKATLSGTGDLTAQGQLTLDGTMGGLLTVGGTQVTVTKLSVGGLIGGSDTALSGGNLTLTGTGGTYAGTLTVDGLTVSGGGQHVLSGMTTVNGDLSVTGGMLTLSGTTRVSGILSVDKGGKATLSGTTTLTGGATASNGGTLTLKSTRTTLGENAWLKADGEGSSIVLDFADASWNKANTNIELSAGGTLDMSRFGGNANKHDIHLQQLKSTGGKLNWGSGKTSVHVGVLSGSALDLGTLAAEQELHLAQLKDVDGAITGTTNGGKVYLGIVDQGENTTGSIQVDGGVHVHSHGGNPDGFWKKGEGSFAVKSQLIVDAGSLYMNYDGTLTFGANGTDGSVRAGLTDSEIRVASGVTLKYTDQDKLLLLGKGLFTGFTEANNDTLHLDLTQTDLSRLSDGFDLGIVSDTEDSALREQLTGVIELDDIEFGKDENGTAGYFELKWHEEADQTYHLYLNIVGNHTTSEPEWDMAWGDGLIGAPSKKDMDDHTWNGENNPFHYDAEAPEAGEFTDHALELGKVDNLHIDRRHTLIRLTQGAAKATDPTAATVVGGIIVDQPDDPKSLYYDSYIEYSATGEKDHLHLLVGGSCCVDKTGGEENAYASFEGTSHIQVESGAVDYIVGGNHVNNSSFTFKGDSYITVFGGQVLGSIVGGSTLTGGTSNHDLYAFNGDTHIFIYTPLGGAEETPAISDGTGHGAAFTAVVGGNAWVDFVSAQGEIRPQFFGHTDITVDLVNPAYEGNKDNPYTFGAGRGEGTFEKAIVGGNYTAAVAPEEGTSGGQDGTRTTVFRGDARIVIYAGEGHTFTAGINGASRWDSGGTGTTEFTGDTLVEIHGGQYTEAVAGGMWFNATKSKSAVHTGTFTGNTDVRIADGSFRRVVGGNVSLEGGSGSTETFTGVSNVTITGGTFAAREQDTLVATEIPAVVGGSFHRNTTGTATHNAGSDGASVLANVTITGGTFSYVHIVGGDCVNMSGVSDGQVTLEGGTRLVIGQAGSAVGPDIVGLLSGGSHLSDSGVGGNISVGKGGMKYATEVEIHGGNITAEGGDGNPHVHGNVVVVAGNVLLDSSTANGGGHKSEILGGTHLVMDGGTVNGHVVGGSYSSDSKGGTNELIIAGDSTMEFTGGTVNGNIVGGHFSENTTAPDELTLGNVGITVAGGTVNGYIFGGSFRKATQALGGGASPTQDEITVKLESGTIRGGVYAAGNNYHTGEGAELHVRTTSTRVEIGSGMQFEVGTQSGEEDQYIVVSGGYLRSSDTDTRANDFSTVGYDEAGKTWKDGCAVLSFTDAPNTYTDLASAKMRFQDFDAVEVQSGKLELSESQLLVMHKVAAEGERGHDSFAKMGEGSLVLGKGLGSFRGQSAPEDAADVVGDFTGGFIIEGGSLTLGTDREGGYTQVIGGLQVDMEGRSGGNKNDAYLRGMNGVRFSAAQGTQLKLVYDGRSDSGVALLPGVYYLVDGLDISLPEGMSVNEYFGFDPDSTDSLWNGAKGDGKYEFGLELGGENNDQLVLRVHSVDPDEWIWEGNEGSTWTQKGDEDELAKDWTIDPENVDKESIQGDTYYFNAGGKVDAVQIDGEVRAGVVHVTSGNYTFEQKTGKDDTLTVGELIVGTKGGAEGEAHLRLELETSVSKVTVWQDGCLELGHANALRGVEELHLQGGSLMYGEDGNGNLASRADLSRQVTADSAGALRVQVGNSAQEGQTEAAPDDLSVTWQGGVATNRGVALAVQQGLFTSGRGKFVLDWQAAADKDKNFIGSLEAQEGTLELKATGANITITAPGESGQPRLFAGEGASVNLVASGTGSGVTVRRAFSGTGTFAIGENVGSDGASYSLDADNSGFGGTVRLSGNGKDSKVQVNAAGALGGANTTLALAGRSIVLSGEAAAVDPAGQPTSLAMKAITVEGTNYVGGYGTTLPADDNKAITLSATNGITGSGVLASAQGGYSHTLTGDLSGFTGTIAAGVASAAEVALVAAEPTDAQPAAPQSTWTLSGALAPTDGGYTLAAKLAGTGKVCLNYTLNGASPENPGRMLLTGNIGDAGLGQSVSVEHAMADTTLVLAGQNNTSTGNLIFNGHEIWLGDDTHAGNWMGDVAVGTDYDATSRFVLRNGTLGKALENPEDVALVVDTAAMSTVNVGGTAGTKFDEIVINDGGHLSGVGGDITVGRDRGRGQTRVVLYFGEGSYGDGVGEAPGNYLLETGGNLVLTEVQSLFRDGTEDDLKDRAAFVLDFSNQGLIDLLKRHHDAGQESYLHVLSGGSILFNPETVEQQLSELLRTGTYSRLLAGLSFTLGVQGGDLILRGSSSDIYLVLSDEADSRGNKHTVNNAEDAAVLAGKKATLLDEGTVLSVELGDGKAGRSVTVHNLVGLGGSVVEASGEGTLSLDNTAVDPDPVEGQPWLNEENVGDEAHRAQLKGQDTLFDGLLRSADARTTFVKAGAGTLTVGNGTDNGGVDIAGVLRLENGDFTVRGGANGRIGTLSFTYAEGAAYKDGFTLQGGKVSVGALDAAGVFGMVSVREQGVFAFTGNNSAAESLPANLQFVGTGTLEIGGDTDGGKLALGGTSSLQGLNVQVDANSSLTLRDKAALSNVGTVSLADNSVLDLSGSASGTQHSVGTLSDTASGTATLKGGANTDLTLTGNGSFSGTLAGGGKLTVAKGASLSLSNVRANTAPASAWDLTIQGSLTLDTSKQSVNAGPSFRDVVFAEGSTVTLLFDSAASDTTCGSALHTNTFTVGNGVSLELESVGSASPFSDLRIRIAFAESGASMPTETTVTLEGASFLHFESGPVKRQIQYDPATKEYYIEAKAVDINKFDTFLPGMQKNTKAGSDLFNSVSSPGKGGAIADSLADSRSDLSKMLTGLSIMLANPGAKAELARTLTAGAGASISVLGPALAEDLHRQLGSMRNRSLAPANDLPADAKASFPTWHAWITGETGYHKLDADGFAPGYTLNSWGGSVGADATLSAHSSVGLALTAMYGDLDTESADSTSGNIDTVYLSGFLRHAIGAWSHTIALSVGVADVKLDRTVNYGIDSYRTNGSTDGLAFGLLYEVGYTKLVNKRGTFSIQPIANVELRHALIDGYTETGSDAGLQVDDIEQTVLTFGAGVRVQSLLSERAFNNTAMLEARALVKADVGDRSGTSEHAIIHDTTHAEVESAEVGTIGMEAGLGLSLPLGRNLGSVILDGSIEFRSGWTSANASVGYRINF